jgi:hypothetical protein
VRERPTTETFKDWNPRIARFSLYRRAWFRGFSEGFAHFDGIRRWIGFEFSTTVAAERMRPNWSEP